MSDYRNYSNLAADPMAATVYARMADVRDDAAQRTAAPKSGLALVGMRAALQRFVAAQPEYNGPAFLRA